MACFQYSNKLDWYLRSHTLFTYVVNADPTLVFYDRLHPVCGAINIHVVSQDFMHHEAPVADFLRCEHVIHSSLNDDHLLPLSNTKSAFHNQTVSTPVVCGFQARFYRQ